eukprot:CAMPEP_0184866188 /NCGR_PEP_ID=MMETSP0580-20130426/21246_1 /TAXON_ID=1118495 /ORGANISM="Dactyliosolen fragilissimus" /LENGTH=298 /DNA_ID=CAMNT_0027365723 /DNA_START=140 /DNA_END=1036 /DNA_ORIENTATION=+
MSVSLLLASWTFQNPFIFHVQSFSPSTGPSFQRREPFAIVSIGGNGATSTSGIWSTTSTAFKIFHHDRTTASTSTSSKTRTTQNSRNRLFVTANTNGENNSKSKKNDNNNRLEKIPDDDDTPIPFLDVDGRSFIECYADSVAHLNGVEYTIGSPCDHSVALCYFDTEDQLLPIELDDDLMDEIFPIAESIVEDEFGEELTLQRTPQTLTLVGELEDGEDDEDDDDDDDVDDDEEDVEILLTFEHERMEYNLVRLLDPVLLVGKPDANNPSKRTLLTPEESDEVMPILEEMFLSHQDEL